jgi:hypothetical protein
VIEGCRGGKAVHRGEKSTVNPKHSTDLTKAIVNPAAVLANSLGLHRRVAR